VRRPDEVKAIIGKVKEGEPVALRIRRGNEAVYLAVRIGGGK
jgi:serine protease Do